MTRAAGPILGLVGAGIGFAIAGWGGARFGASVGWLVGSWVSATFAGQKKENITPDNMPKFNTALRGAVMPVLFGTNRVAAQIAWQGGFQAIRSADSGGKAGGSGAGGGKGAAQSGSQSAYNYRIDAVYHVGMVPAPAAMIRIWNGATQISDQVTRSISVTHPTNFFAEQPDDDAVGNTLTFDSSAFFDGSDPSISSWSVMQAAVGANVHWPGSVWAGFEGLSMGPSATLPQLSFEIGPSDVEWYYSRLLLGKSATNEQAFVFASRRPDVNGNIWMYEVGAMATNRLRCYSEATGAQLSEYELHAEMATLLATFGYAYVFNDSHHVILNANGTKLVYVSNFRVNDATAGSLNNTNFIQIATANISANGTLSWKGGAILQVPLLYAGSSLFGIGGTGRDSDPIFVSNDSSTNTQTYFILCPPINFIEGDFVVPMATIAYQFTDTTYSKNWLSSFAASKWGDSPKGVVIPEYDVDGLFALNRVYYYFGKNVVEGNGQNGVAAFDNLWVNTWRATHANGGLVYFTLPTYNLFTIGTAALGVTVTAISNPLAADSSFEKQDGTLYSYFSDDYKDLTDGVTVNNQHWYHSDPFVNRLPSGAMLVVWGSSTLTDTSYTGDYRPKSKVRGFVYNPLTNKFYEVSSAVDISYGQMTADYGASNNVGKVAVHHHAYRLTNSRLHVYQHMDNVLSDTLKQVYIWQDAGPLNPGTGKDVWPPYIIREVLVNSKFGIYPGADIIDETSYAVAVEYCAVNNIGISCVVNQQDSGIAFMQMVLATYGGWLAVDAATNKIKFGVSDLSNSPVRTVDNSHLVRDGDKPPISSTKGAGQDTYNIVRINYFDRALNYEPNQIEEGDEVDQDIYGERLKEFPLKFVMSELTARQMAVRTLWSNLYGRDTHGFQLSWKDADLEPGDLVTLVDSFSGLNQVVQITRMEEVKHGLFSVDAQQQLQYVPGYLPSQISSASWDYINTGGISSYTSVSCAYEFPVANGIYGARAASVFELPKEFEVSESGKIYVAWGAHGRPAGATLYLSADGSTYAPATNVTPYQIYGSLLTNLPANTGFAENVDLFLAPSSAYSVNSQFWDYPDTLLDVSQDAMHAGAGLMWVGSEMLSFASLTLIRQNQYRAARVYRGWGGTPVGAHSSGDLFYKQGAGVFAVPYSANQIGNTLYFKVAPFGFNGIEYPVSSIDATQYTVRGLFYKPRIPSDLQYESRRGETKFNVGSAGDLGIYWKDCAQQSGFGAGGYGQNPGGYGHYSADVSSLGYHVAVVGSGNATVRSSYVNTAAFTYSNSQNASDNGAWRGNVAFRVTPANPYGLANGTSVLSLELFF